MKFPLPNLADCPGCEKRREAFVSTANKALDWLKERANTRTQRGGQRPPVRTRETIEAEIKAKKERTKMENGS